MRMIVALLAVAACVLAVPPYKAGRTHIKPKILEDFLHEVSECIRENLNAGDPENNVPSFNPLQLENAVANLTKLGIPQYIRGVVNLEDLYVEGVTSWQFSNVSDSVSLIPLGYTIYFTVDIPEISGSASYNGELVLLDEIEVSGSGNAGGYVKNIHVQGYIVVTIADNSISLEDVSITGSVGDIEFTIDGLIVDGEDVSEEVSDYLTNALSDYINNNPEEVSALIESVVLDIFDDIAHGETGESAIGLVASKCLGN